MSTDGNLIPDRISGGSEGPGNPGSTEQSGFATDRGLHTSVSALGLERYDRVPHTEEIDANTRSSFAKIFLVLLGCLFVLGLLALMVLSMSGAPTQPVEIFLARLETPFFSVASAVAGYLFARREVKARPAQE